MTDGIVIREANPGDLPAMVSMLERMYTRQKLKEFLTWQCFENINPSVLMCAFSEDELVGMFGVQRRALTNGLVAGQASWLNVAPGYQSKGVFSTLGSVAIDRFGRSDFLCVFANSTAKSACEKSFGFQTVGALRTMTLDAAMVTQAAPGARVRPVDEQSFSEEERGGYHAFVFASPPVYRTWRYVRSPVNAYALVQLETGEFAVVKRFQAPGAGTCTGDIVDFQCPLDDAGKLERLFLTASAQLKAMGCAAITTWAVPESCLYDVIREIGFREGPVATYFQVKALTAQSETLYDFKAWHLRQADATNY